MDTRIININYSVPAMQLIVKLANLCLSVKLEECPPDFPFIIPNTGNRMIGQVWGHSPPTCGTLTYWSLADNCEDVQMWDPEVQDEEPGDCPPLYVFKLAEMDDFIAKWLVGDV